MMQTPSPFSLLLLSGSSAALISERDGITEFLASLEATKPGMGKRNPNESINESVLEEVLKGKS
jgi:hypothetical protein